MVMYDDGTKTWRIDKSDAKLVQILLDSAKTRVKNEESRKIIDDLVQAIEGNWGSGAPHG